MVLSMVQCAPVYRGTRPVASDPDDTDHAMIRRLPAMSHAVDAAGRIIEVSEPWLDRLGYARDEVIGRPLSHFMTGDARRRHGEEIMRTVLRTGRCTDVPCRFVTSDGEGIDMLLSATAERGANGAVRQCLAVLTKVPEPPRAHSRTLTKAAFCRAIFDNAGGGLCLVDEAGTVVRANPVFAALFDQSVDDVLGAPFLDLLPAADRAAAAALLQHPASGVPGATAVEWDVPGCGGGRRQLHATFGGFTTDEAGVENEHFVVVTVTDVTQRQQSQQALRDSEARYRLMAEYATDMIWRITPAGDILYVSPACRVQLGQTPEGLAGGNLHDLLHPEDRPLFIAQDWRVPLGSIGRKHIVHRMRCRDGRDVWLETTGRAVIDPATGAIREIVLSSRNVTGRKCAEEERNRLFALSMDMLAIGTTSGHLVRVNPAFTRTLGFTEAELLSKPVTEWLHPDDRAPTMEALRRLSAGEPGYNFENRYRHKDGGYRWTSWNATASGDLVYAVGRDVTDQKRNAEALLRAKEEAERSSRAKTAFLANMSHELRTPLNAIIGFSEILMEQMFGPLGHDSYRGYASDIHTSGQRLLHVINNILEVTKLEGGGLDLEDRPVPLRAEIELVAGLMHPAAAKAAVAVVSDIPPDLPAVQSDRSAIRQILMNVMENAVKFTPDGGTVTVRAGCRPDGGVSIAVSDTGIGIPAEDLDRILEPFQQVAPHMVRSRPGAGLGLAIVKSLVEAHDGRLQVASQPDRGTTVFINFPAERTIG